MSSLFRFIYDMVELLSLVCKIYYLDFKFKILLLQNRHLRFKINDILSQNSRKRNFFQYIGDYAHDVLLFNFSLSNK